MELWTIVIIQIFVLIISYGQLSKRNYYYHKSKLFLSLVDTKNFFWHRTIIIVITIISVTRSTVAQYGITALIGKIWHVVPNSQILQNIHITGRDYMTTLILLPHITLICKESIDVLTDSGEKNLRQVPNWSTLFCTMYVGAGVHIMCSPYAQPVDEISTIISYYTLGNKHTGFSFEFFRTVLNLGNLSSLPYTIHRFCNLKYCLD